MIHVCPECGYNDVIEDKVISGHKEVINMTDKDRDFEIWASDKLDLEKAENGEYVSLSARIAHQAWQEAARTERERILDAVNILITAWSVDHKDWREFDVGYTSALEQVAGMIRKDLTPESATEPRTCETCKAVDGLMENNAYCIDCGARASPRPVSAEDVETVREYVLSTIG